MTAAPFGLALRQARRKRGLSLRGLQALVQYDFTYLGQVERGEKPGSLAVAASCDEALAAGGRLVQAFRKSADLALSSHPVGIVSRHVPNPGPLDGWSADPEFCDAVTLRTLYHGTYCVEELSARARDCVDLASCASRSARGASERRGRLHRLADLALLAGRLALFDTWVPVVARGYLTTACEAAVEAEDDALAAAAAGHLAFVAARERLASASVDYLRVAQRHAERSGVPSVESWVAAVAAELLVDVSRDDARRALDRAVDALAREATAPRPSWFDFFSAARLEGFRGQVLLSAGRGEDARQSLGRALIGLETDSVKQRAVLLADLAASHLHGRDPDVEQAAALALQAARELRRTRYLVAAERLAALRRRLTPWQDSRSVQELDEALAGSSDASVVV